MGPNRCASACVFMFLGGVERWGVGKIGLHRPFSSSISNSTKEARLSFEKTNQLIKEYLSEMNVPPRLLDVMNAVPPGKIKWLDIETDWALLKELYIVGTDPVFQEESDSAAAKFLGISKKEFYRRQMKADAICGEQGSGSKAEEIIAIDQCHWSVLSGKKPASK